MKIKKETKNEDLAAIGIGAMIVFIALILVAAVASAVIIQTGEKLQQNAQQTGDDTQREISGKITINNAYIKSTEFMRIYFESAPGSGIISTDDIAWQVSCTNDATVDGTSANGPVSTGYQFTAGTFGDGPSATGLVTNLNGDFLVDANDEFPRFSNDHLDAPVLAGDVYSMDDPEFADDGAGVGDANNGFADTGETDNRIGNVLPGDAYVIDIDVDGDGTGGDDCTFDEVGINGKLTFWIHVEGGGSTYETILITDTSFGALLI